jgi:hypothetical protein
MVMRVVRMIQSFAVLQSSDKEPSRIQSALASFFSVVEEGFNKAEQYEALMRKSDSELAALGLRREDLPHYVWKGLKR